MNVLMVQPRFEEAVVSGRKPHSIRPPRRDGRPRARVGEVLSIRVWAGKPYRSKQREIAQVVVMEVAWISVQSQGVDLRGRFLWQSRDDLALRELANSDGFDTWSEMRDWFATTHGLPFTGWLIRWRLIAFASPIPPPPGVVFDWNKWSRLPVTLRERAFFGSTTMNSEGAKARSSKTPN